MFTCSCFITVLLLFSNHVLCAENHGKFDLTKLLANQTLDGNTDLKHFLTPEMKEALNGVDMASLIQRFKQIDVSSLGISPECNASFTKMFGVLAKIKKLDPATILEILSQPVGKVLDSFGKPPPRIFIGNLNWIGAYDECSNIEGMKHCINTMTFLYYPGRYGTCFPKECSTTDLQKVVLPVINSALMGLVRLKSDMICEEPMKLSRGNKATIAVCVILMILCLIGTVCEISFELLANCQNRTSQSYLSEDDATVEITTFEKESDHRPINTGENSSMRHGNSQDSKEKGIVYDLLTSFSVIKNTRAILSTDSPKGAIGSINGIRTISMFWVILGHVYFFGSIMRSFDNLLSVGEIIHRFSFIAIGNAFFSVDSFFLLSGLLVAYLMFRRFDTNKGSLGSLVVKILLSNIHRFIRLTPSLLFLMLFYMYIFPLLITGPNAAGFQQSEAFVKPCLDYWWANLLYINNFYPKSMGAQCVGWVWYLANDMQFYLFAPVILVPMFLLDQKFANSRLRYVVPLAYLGGWVLLFLLITAIIIGHWDLPAMQVASSFPGNPRATRAGQFGDYAYEKPYTRISPYLVGLGLGYILSRKVRMLHNLKPLIAVIGWVVAVAIGMSVVYGPWKVFAKDPKFLNDAENISYGTLSRFAWGLALAWVIYACHSNVGWLVDSFLSWKLWIPLSRLTYGAYLFHPVVLIYFYTVGENAYHYQDNLYVFNIISIVVVSYASSFVLAVGLEFPVLNVEKRLLKW